MKSERILRIISLHFNLITRTEYHFQIEIGDKKYHNFWVSKEGLKVKLYGNEDINVFNNADKLLNILQAYSKQSNHFDELRYLINLREVKNELFKKGIFCDAGFKVIDTNTVSKVAVIRIGDNKEIDIHSRTIIGLNNNVEAEIEAIKLAINKFINIDETIYSDCKPAIDKIKKINPNVSHRLVWVDRNFNREANKLATIQLRDAK